MDTGGGIGSGGGQGGDKMYSLIRPNMITIDKYIRINKDQYMFFLQLSQECDIYDYEIYNQDQIIRKGRNIFQIKNNGKQYHYLLISRHQNYFLKFYFYRIVGKSNEIQLIDEKFLFIDVNKWIKENKNSSNSSLNTFIPKKNVEMEIKPYNPVGLNHNKKPIETTTKNIGNIGNISNISNNGNGAGNSYVHEYIHQQYHSNYKYSPDGECDENEENDVNEIDDEERDDPDEDS